LTELPSSYRFNQTHPIKVFRKTKQHNLVDFSGIFTLEHTVYLVLGEALVPGASYELSFPDGMLNRNAYSFIFDPRSARSDAVHIIQVGFRPDDPAKCGYLSQWMSLGGGITYTDQKEFELLDRTYGGPKNGLFQPISPETLCRYRDFTVQPLHLAEG